jgi:hypothetical protein
MKLGQYGRQSLALVFVALVVSSGIVAAVGGTVDWSSDPAPNLEYAREETKSVHQMDWGTSDDALRKYENNNGDIVKMEATINDSADNPISFVPTDIEVDGLGAFPHSKSNVNATDAGEWSVDTSGVSTTGATADVSDAETAPNVEAVRFSTTDLASGDTAKFTFDNFSITSDEDKRYLVVGQDIATLDSGATVEYRVVDEDGDYRAAEINTSRSSGEDFMANATGEGYLYQRQLGSMDLTVNGDGTFNNVQKVVVVVQDGDIDASVPYVNIETMSPYDFGSKKADNDSDDGLETVDHLEKKTAGAYELTGLDTLGSAFDNAVINSVTLDVVEEPAEQPDNNVFINTTETDKYPSYDGTATIAVRMEAEDAYDRSIATAVLRDTQSVTSERVLSIKYAEGVPADEAVDQAYLDNRTFNDMTGQYGSEGKEVQLDSSLSKGSAVLVKYKFKLTADQMDALKGATSGGSGTGAKGGSGLGSIPIIGGLLVALLGWLRRGE